MVVVVVVVITIESKKEHAVENTAVLLYMVNFLYMFRSPSGNLQVTGKGKNIPDRLRLAPRAPGGSGSQDFHIIDIRR